MLGNILHAINIKFSVPEDTIISPQAAVLTQNFPADLHYGAGRKPPHIAAGMMAHYFRTPYQRLWDAIAKDTPIVILGKMESEDVRLLEIRCARRCCAHLSFA